MKNGVLALRISQSRKNQIQKWASRRDLSFSQFARKSFDYYIAHNALEGFHDEMKLEAAFRAVEAIEDDGVLCNDAE